MNQFKFRMESVLNIKQKLEDQEKAMFSIAMGNLSQEEAKLNAFFMKKNSYEQKLCTLIGAKLILLEIRNYEMALKNIKEQILLQQMAVNRAKKQVELARLRLKDAMLERKTFEKLKEKQWTLYQEEFEQEERKQVDELVSYTYGLRSKGQVAGA